MREDGGAIVNGFGGGIMACGDPAVEPGGEVRIMWAASDQVLCS